MAFGTSYNSSTHRYVRISVITRVRSSCNNSVIYDIRTIVGPRTTCSVARHPHRAPAIRHATAVLLVIAQISKCITYANLTNDDKSNSTKHSLLVSIYKSQVRNK